MYDIKKLWFFFSRSWGSDPGQKPYHWVTPETWDFTWIVPESLLIRIKSRTVAVFSTSSSPMGNTHTQIHLKQICLRALMSITDKWHMQQHTVITVKKWRGNVPIWFLANKRCVLQDTPASLSTLALRAWCWLVVTEHCVRNNEAAIKLC